MNKNPNLPANALPVQNVEVGMRLVDRAGEVHTVVKVNPHYIVTDKSQAWTYSYGGTFRLAETV